MPFGRQVLLSRHEHASVLTHPKEPGGINDYVGSSVIFTYFEEMGAPNWVQTYYGFESPHLYHNIVCGRPETHFNPAFDDRALLALELRTQGSIPRVNLSSACNKHMPKLM